MIRVGSDIGRTVSDCPGESVRIKRATHDIETRVGILWKNDCLDVIELSVYNFTQPLGGGMREGTF